MADDDNERDGIGAGTVATGLAGATAASALTTSAINRKLAPANPGNSGTQVEKTVQAAHDHAQGHTDALNEALTKRADDVLAAEQAALDKWAKDGSPEAIRSADPVRIKDSIEQGQKYQKAETALRAAEAKLRTARRDLRPTIREDLKNYPDRWYRKLRSAAIEKPNLRAEFAPHAWHKPTRWLTWFAAPVATAAPATNAIAKPRVWPFKWPVGWRKLNPNAWMNWNAFRVTPFYFGERHLKHYIAWREEGKNIPNLAERIAYQANPPRKFKKLTGAAQEELVKWCDWYDVQMRRIKGLDDVEPRVTRIVDNDPLVRELEREVTKQNGIIAAGTPLRAEWNTAVDKAPEVAEARKKLADAERFARRTSNLEVKRWSKGGAAIIEEESGALKKMGQAMSRAFEARPVMMIAAPAVTLGAILAVGHLLSGKHQSEHQSGNAAAWQTQINNERETRTQGNPVRA